jgi:pilus assembly protein Flp/PilA
MTRGIAPRNCGEYSPHLGIQSQFHPWLEYPFNERWNMFPENLLRNMSVKMYLLKDALLSEQGQDLIEYALVFALIAFAATASMRTLATHINTAFLTLGTDLTTAIA